MPAQTRLFAADFETTGALDYEIDGYTRVYHACMKDVDSGEYLTFDNIGGFFDWFQGLSCNVLVHFFNLSFDGSFIVDEALRRGMISETFMEKKEREDAKKEAKKEWLISQGKQATYYDETGKRKKTYIPRKVTEEFEEHNNSFTLIKSGSKWIQLVMKNERGFKATFYDIGNHYTTCTNLEDVAKELGVPGKTELHVDMRRDPSYVAGEEEALRCRRDVDITAEAVRLMRDKGLNGSTLASDAWKIWRGMFVAQVAEERGCDAKEASDIIDKEIFPKLTEKVRFSDGFEMDIRDAYLGGRVYIRPKYKDMELKHVSCIDRNSMYPSVMKQCLMPYGRPILSVGKPKTEWYIMSCKCTFKLKKGMDPTVQKKKTFRSTEPEWIYESEPTGTCLTMTSVDWELFLDHYDVLDWNMCVKHYVSFNVKPGEAFFGRYIDKMAQDKKDAKDRMNETKGSEEYYGHKGDYYVAKILMNALYGKTGQQYEKPYQWAELEDERVKIRESDLSKGEFFAPYGHKYLPVACFITANARKELIRVFESVEYPVYCDTDSVYYIEDGEGNKACRNGFKMTEKDIEDAGIELHPSKLGAWDVEKSDWEGRFLRAKTYILRKDGVMVVKCGGMPVKVKEHVTWENFHMGMEFEAGTGKLLPKMVPGGKILKPISYKMGD